MHELRYNEITGGMLPEMSITPLLQERIGSIEGEEEGHEHDLCDEDVVGISAWPSIEVVADESFKFDDITADEEDGAGQEHAQGQHFRCIDQHIVQALPSQGAKRAMSTHHTIQDDLQHLGIDDPQNRRMTTKCSTATEDCGTSSFVRMPAKAGCANERKDYLNNLRLFRGGYCGGSC